MIEMYDDQLIETLRQGVIGLLDKWGLDPQTNVELLTISENATFRAEEPDSGRQIVLRVHRPGYHTQQEIESELDWIVALREEGIVETPEPLIVKGGRHLTSFEMQGEQRFVTAFAFMTGVEPSPTENLNSGFERLGAISARLHQQVRTWKQPSSFVRKIWNFDTTVGPKPHWGDWRDAPKLTKDGEQLLERTCLELKRQLNEFGEGSDRFGLIHADLRLANLLVEGDRLGIIDFDDCGFGWFVYDFAAAVSFFEHEPIVAELEDSWIRGYRSVAPLSEEDAKMFPTFVLLRRLLLTAWIGSHAETPAAQDVIETYTAGTLALADDFLSRT
ncbi:MAG: phosphotransferase [Deltaproteobacteria bacterium]|nr:phosphotransferase [Deltaproteobacteria bacterium]